MSTVEKLPHNADTSHTSPQGRKLTRYIFLPVSFVTGAGVVLLAAAQTLARLSVDYSAPLYWLSLLAIFVPIAWRLSLPATTVARSERLALVTLLGLALYMVKVLHSPTEFTFSDEFTHIRTATDIIQDGRLFNRNPLLPISAVYPGLEIVVSSLHFLGGLSVFAGGMAVLALGRGLLMVALFLFYEQVNGSARLAGIATLLYTANAGFVYFDAQYAYESLALPMAAFGLYIIFRLGLARQGSEKNYYRVISLVLLGAVIVTHHLTSYMITAFLVVWALVGLLYRWRRPALAKSQYVPYGLAGLSVAGCAAWLVFAANGVTVNYIAPHLIRGTGELLQILTGQLKQRVLFQSFSGQSSPLWEQIVTYFTIALILLVLPWGLWYVWRNRRDNILMVTLAIGSLGFPASLALRLTQFGSESSNRAAEFVFLALSVIMAYAVMQYWLNRDTALRRNLFVAGATIIFMGGVILGWGPWARMPGNYQVVADPRSAEPESVQAAIWSGQYLGADNRFATDRPNRHRQGTFGDQYTVTNFGDLMNTGDLFLTTKLEVPQIGVLRLGEIRYLLSDVRITTGLPLAGIYYEQGEIDAFQHKTPPALAQITKFENYPGTQRIFDSGNVIIYDVSYLSGLQPRNYQEVKPANTTNLIYPQEFNFGGLLLALLGLGGVLLLPGYAVLLAGRLPGELPTPLEQLVIAFGTSLSLNVLSGLLLHFSPWGLQTFSWLGLLLAITTGAGAVAIIRRIKVGKFSGLALPKIAWKVGLKGLPVAVLFVVAFSLAILGVGTVTQPGFTQLWMLPQQSNNTVQLGLHSEEHQTATYRLVLQANGQPVAEWEKVELKPGQTWQSDKAVNLTSNVKNGKIEALLYKTDDSQTVYRRVAINTLPANK